MNKMILSLLLLISLPSYAEEFLSVCQRNPGIRDAMESRLRKPCGSITREDLNDLIELPAFDRNLTQISSSDLQDLENLVSLYLQSNQITHIEPGTFSGLRKLKNLNLIGNNISELQLGVFAGLHDLRILALSENPIHDLNVQVFKDLPTLRSLYMDNTLLRRFPMGLCSAGSEISTIHLVNNLDLTKIDDFAFAQCAPETLIFIEGSPLTFTRKAAFNGNTKVSGLPANFDVDAPSDEWGQP